MYLDNILSKLDKYIFLAECVFGSGDVKIKLILGRESLNEIPWEHQ